MNSLVEKEEKEKETLSDFFFISFPIFCGEVEGRD